jgi:hypothetical protein
MDRIAAIAFFGSEYRGWVDVYCREDASGELVRRWRYGSPI